MLSLAYAAPEVVNAYSRSEATVRASEAIDIWALGVMAFELLTKTVVFPAFTPKEHVLRVAAGKGPNGASSPVRALPGGPAEAAAGGGDGAEMLYPWEGSSASAAAARACLGRLESSIMQCLARQPGARPSAAKVLQEWDAWLNESHGLSKQPSIDTLSAHTAGMGRLGGPESSLGSSDGSTGGDAAAGGAPRRSVGGHRIGGRTFPPGRVELPVLEEAPSSSLDGGTSAAAAAAAQASKAADAVVQVTVVRR